MTESKTTWVPQVGERVRLNARARSAYFISGADGRRRWTVESVRYVPGFAQPDVVMTDGEIWSSVWLESAGVAS